MKRIIILLVLSCSVINAQDLFFKNNKMFTTVMDGKAYVNPYYVGENPAYLFKEKSDERLFVQTYFSNSEGDFKTFFTPGRSRDYQLNIGGKKYISENQVFKGSFSVQKEEREDWNWLTTKYYETGSPFLLSDSTTGGTRYNTLFVNAEYGGRMFDSFLVGASLSYGVDEGLKKVVPRPTSSHRNLFFNVGLGYDLSQNASIGLVFKTYDFNEVINYSVDEGGILQETILLKYRGYDFPLRFSKKEDVRHSYHNGYLGAFTFHYIADKICLSAAFEGGLENISLEDGSANNRTKEGYWKNNILDGELQVLYKPVNSLNVGLHYNFNNKDMWARHPIFSSTYQDSKVQEHNVTLGLETSISEKLTAGLEMNAVVNKMKYNDYYSDLNWKRDQFLLAPKFGLNYSWCSWLETFVAYEYMTSTVKNSELNTGNPTNYFLNMRQYDIVYYMTEFTGHNISFSGTIFTDSIGEFNLYVLYSNINPDEESLFGDVNRTSVRGVVQYRIAVY